MFAYVLRRLAVAVPTLLLLIVLSFLLMHMAPGGPFTQERALPPQVLANQNAKYGLDQPLWRQVLGYIWSVVVHFDFGPSFGGMTLAFFPDPRTFGATLGVRF